MMKWFRGLRGKLLLLVGVAAVAIGTLAFVSMRGMKGMSNNLDIMTEQRLPITEEVGVLRASLNSTLRFSWKAVAQTDMDERKKAIQDSKERIKTFEDAVERFNKLSVSQQSKDIMTAVDADWDNFVGALGEVYKILEKDEAGATQTAATALSGRANDLAGKMTGLIRDLDELGKKRNAEMVTEIEVSEAQIARFVFITVVVSIISLLVFGFWLASMLSRTLANLAANLESGADQVASAATEIASASEELSAACTEQASSLQETAASTEEMSAMVKRNSESANQGRTVSTHSLESAQQGKSVVGEMIRAIDEIDQANTQIMGQIETSNREISEIVKVIGEISEKTKVINDIVFQTKLLSFNASVEAARAGEHGKGFAVVAEEVGQLAQMSGNASKEISSMLAKSIEKVEGIVEDTKSKVEGLVALGKKKVEVGTEVSRRCGEVLDQILGGSNDVNRLVGEIVTASDEQANGIQEITKAMAQLDQVTQQNTAASHQAASAAEQLSGQAETMRTAVAQLVAVIEGSSDQSKKSTSNSGLASGPKVTQAKGKKAAKASLKAVPSPKKTPSETTSSSDLPSENDPRFEDVA